MRLPSAIRAGLILCASAVSLRANDPALIGFWLESTPAPSQGFTENILWEVFPEDELDEHWQHTRPGDPVVMNGRSFDVNTYPTLFQTDNGRLTLTEEDHSTRSGSYVICPDKKKMIVKFDDVNFAFLFTKYGTIQNDKEWTSHPDPSGVEFRDASGSNDPNAGITSRLGLGGPAHWIEPGFVGLWVDPGPRAADSSMKVSLWELHADGQSTLHIQKTTPSQPLVFGTSDHDIQTIDGTLDAFGGRFVMASQNGAAKDTGRYQMTNNQLVLSFDKGGPVLTFTRYGLFNMDGSVQKQSSFPF